MSSNGNTYALVCFFAAGKNVLYSCVLQEDSLTVSHDLHQQVVVRIICLIFNFFKQLHVFSIAVSKVSNDI